MASFRWMTSRRAFFTVVADLRGGEEELNPAVVEVGQGDRLALRVLLLHVQRGRLARLGLARRSDTGRGSSPPAPSARPASRAARSDTR